MCFYLDLVECLHLISICPCLLAGQANVCGPKNHPSIHQESIQFYILLFFFFFLNICIYTVYFLLFGPIFICTLLYIYIYGIYIYIGISFCISVYHIIYRYISYIYMIYISLNLVIWPYISILFWAKHLGSQSLGSSPGRFSSFGDNKQMIFKMENHKPSRKYQIYIHSKINLSYFIILWI